MEREIKYAEKYGEDEITCPYCGEEFGDSWECGSTGGEYTEDCEECPDCGKKFTWTRNIAVDYTSSPDCELNEEDHKYGDWIHFDHDTYNGSGRTKGRKKICSICGETKYEFDKET